MFKLLLVIVLSVINPLLAKANPRFCTTAAKNAYNSFLGSVSCSANNMYLLYKSTRTRWNSVTSEYVHTVTFDFRYCWDNSYAGQTEPAFVTGCSQDIDVDSLKLDIEEPQSACGSTIYKSQQILGEEIPLTGSEISLKYFSNRVFGRTSDYIIKIPITANSTIAGVTGYDLQVKDSANVVLYSSSFGNSPSQIYYFNSNGLNSSGQEAWSSIEYRVAIQENFIGSSENYNYIVRVGSLKNKKLGLGGWVPSNWYYYDNADKKLYKPDGTERTVEAISWPGGFYLVAEKDGSLVYIFDSAGKIVETKLGLTGQTIYSFYYDGFGRLSYINEPFSKVTTFNRDGSGILTSITTPNGKVITVSLDANGYLATVTNPNSETYEMTYYGSGGLLATFQKPNGAVSSFTYSNGNLVSDIHSSGSEVNLTKTMLSGGMYDLETESAMGRANIIHSISNGDILTEQEYRSDGSVFYSTSNDLYSVFMSNGISETNNYSSDARFGNTSKNISSKAIGKLGYRVTNYSNSYTLTNNADPFSIDNITIISTIGSGNYPVTSTYVGATKTTTRETYLGITTTTEMDNYQRPVSIQKGSLNPTVMTYTNDKLTKTTHGSRETNYYYNPTTELLESITNALNEVTSYAYDSAERLTKTILPDLREINYAYDSQGNLISITPPSSPAHTMSIGANEKLSSYNPPTLSGVPIVNTTYTYNLDNQLTEIERPDGQTIEYVYGATSGRLEKITTAAGDYDYTYGLLGSNISLPTKIEAPDNSSVSLSYSYGVVSGQTVNDVSNNTIYSYSVTSTQHAQINSDSLSAGANTIGVNYTYDDDERLLTVGDIYLSYWDIYGAGLNDGSSGPDLLYETYNYDSNGEVTQYRGVGDGSPFYTNTINARDLLGRVTERTEYIRPGSTNVYNYTYDSAGRLTEVEKNSVVVGTYTYDSNSNRNGGNNGDLITATYDNQDRLLTYKNHTFTYNANGDLASKTYVPTNDVTTYSYDVFGNLTQVVTPTKTIVYEIDALNRRVGKKVNGNLVVRYAYDLQDRLIGEINPSGDLIRRYVYVNKSHVPGYFIDSSNEKYRLYTDHLGSVRVVVRGSDEVMVQKMNHDEFGRLSSDTNPGFQPFGFAGGLWDPDTGLVRFGARDYDPMTGRWTSKDPIRFAADNTNLFGYVLNDPINLIDPSGLEDECAFDCPPGNMTNIVGGGGSSGTVYVTPGGTAVPTAPGSTVSPTPRNTGLIIDPPGSQAASGRIRIMDPTTQYPNGYIRVQDRGGNYLDINGNRVEKDDPAGHICPKP